MHTTTQTILWSCSSLPDFLKCFWVQFLLAWHAEGPFSSKDTITFLEAFLAPAADESRTSFLHLVAWGFLLFYFGLDALFFK